MAGLGTRFQNEAYRNPEYKKPKPFINIKGYPMIRWATGSLPFLQHKDENPKEHILATLKDLIFIILQEHQDKFSLKEKLQEVYGDEIKVIIIPKLTRGAAETAYRAHEYVDPEEELIVSDSDHHFDGTKLMELINTKDEDTMGIIPVFKVYDQSPKWSYSLIERENYITAVGEKDVELAKKGAMANIGAYYYTKSKVFFDEVKNMIESNEMYGAQDKKEFYVAPVYDRLIKKGLKVQAVILDEVYGLGTPEDLEYFVSHYNRDLRQR